MRLVEATFRVMPLVARNFPFRCTPVACPCPSCPAISPPTHPLTHSLTHSLSLSLALLCSAGSTLLSLTVFGMNSLTRSLTRFSLAPSLPPSLTQSPLTPCARALSRFDLPLCECLWRPLASFARLVSLRFVSGRVEARRQRSQLSGGLRGLHVATRV